MTTTTMVKPRKAKGAKAKDHVKPSDCVPSANGDVPHSDGETANGAMKPTVALPSLCLELQSLQRQRAVVLKSRNMQANRLQAIVAGTLGYHSGMAEKDRQAKFGEASKLIEAIAGGAEGHPLRKIVLATQVGVDSFNKTLADLEKEMRKQSALLPVADWVACPEQRGFGMLFLAIVIGETGDLSGYANPGKVWRRLGCAPWSHDHKTLMGATWRSGREGKLPADEWASFGYSPRRRSIAFLIGEGIVKQNFVRGGAGDGCVETDALSAGPYRARYDETKAKLQADHPDYPKLRCHRHGMLLATKLLLKNLWIEWWKASPHL